MRFIFLHIALFLICPSLQAQTQSITVLQGNIAIPMLTASHYQNGSSVTTVAAVLISSDVKWDLSIRASGPLVSGPNSISENNIGVKVNTPLGNAVPERFLSLSDQLIVDAAAKTYIALVDIPVAVDIKFRAIGGSGFFNKPASSYTTTITYTISPD